MGLVQHPAAIRHPSAAYPARGSRRDPTPWQTDRVSSIDRAGTLLYDEDCGICVATARWLADRVEPRRLGLLAIGQVETDSRIATLAAGRPLTASVHFVRADDTVLRGARAVLAAGRLVPRWRFLVLPFDQPLGHLFLEPLYRLIAANRGRIGRALGLPAACALPPRRRGTD